MLPHTADLRIEAWAPTAAGCYEEAVSALVSAFAEPGPETSSFSRWRFELGPGTPDELLVLLLEEVMVALEVGGVVPTGSEVEVRTDRLVGSFTAVPASDVEGVGPVPKGVSYHQLSFARTPHGWRGRATVDV